MSACLISVADREAPQIRSHTCRTLQYDAIDVGASCAQNLPYSDVNRQAIHLLVSKLSQQSWCVRMVVLANMAFRRPSIQREIRRLGGVELLLSQCQASIGP